MLVDAIGQYGLVCEQAPSRITRYQQLNDLMTRALVAAGVSAAEKPIGLIRQDGKRPDGTTQIPRCSGKLLVCDVKVVSTLADSYVVTTACGRGEVGELAAAMKWEKYVVIPLAYFFQSSWKPWAQ